jgi:hypothetical protein
VGDPSSSGLLGGAGPVPTGVSGRVQRALATRAGGEPYELP